MSLESFSWRLDQVLSSGAHRLVGSRALLELAHAQGCCCHGSYYLLDGACLESSSPCSHHRTVDPLKGQVESARPEISGVLLFPFHPLRKEEPSRSARARGPSGRDPLLHAAMEFSFCLFIFLKNEDQTQWD